MPIITIDARDFLRGVSTTDELADGGFSPLSKGINLFAEPGLILPGQAPTDTSDTPDIAAGIFAWTAVSSAGFFGRAVGADGLKNGRFYLINEDGEIGETITEDAENYVANITDLLHYGANMYITSENDITRTTVDFGTVDAAWWGTTLGLSTFDTFSPHHMTQFGEILYIADKNMIHTWDGSSGVYNALDLPAGFVIDDITVYNNLIYIAASPSTRFNEGVLAKCRIFTWDGFSASFLDEFIIQERIVTFISFGGTLFVGTQEYFGYFTGTTINALYPLTQKVYKHQVGVTNDRIYMLQGINVLCYGNPIINRPKFFSFPLKHTSTLIGMTCIQTGSLVYSYAGKIGAWSDVDGSDQTGGIFYSNRLPLRSNAYIRGVIIESQALASGSSQTIAFINDSAETKTVGTYSHAALGAVSRRHFDVNGKASTLTAQAKITFGATPNKGIRRIHVWYEPIQLRARS